MERDLKLERIFSNNRFTGGNMFLDNKFLCFSCEDIHREIKIPGETRIPAGRYKVGVVFSPKHGPNTLQLQNVPDFTGIQIHVGNSEVDTEGCILVGDDLTADSSIQHPLTKSRSCFDRIHPILLPIAQAGDLWISIIDRDR